jgi:hypothetical protein
LISVGSVVRVYPGPPFILVNVVLVGVADAVDKIVWVMVLMDGLYANSYWLLPPLKRLGL